MGDVDIQTILFGRSPPILAGDRAPETTDALDAAINEIKEIGVAQTFLDDPHNPLSDHDQDEILPNVPAWQKGFQCMHAHDGTEAQNNPNSRTIEVLSKMQQYYERTNDGWRAISYRRAISALKKCQQYVSTEEQARKYIPLGSKFNGVGFLR